MFRDLDAVGILTVLACGLAQLGPRRPLVVGYIPIAALDLQFGRNAVCAICTIRTVRTVGAIRPLRPNLLPVYQNKLAVRRPVIDAVRILFDADNGRLAIDTVRAVPAVVDDDRVALGELDRIADHFAVLGQRIDAHNAVVVLERRHEPLLGCKVGVGFVAKPLQRLECRPCGKLDARAVRQREDHIVGRRRIIDPREDGIAVDSVLAIGAVLTVARPRRVHEAPLS